MCTEIGYTKRSAFENVLLLNETLNLKNPHAVTEKTKKVLNELGCILSTGSTKTCRVNSAICITDTGLLSSFAYAISTATTGGIGIGMLGTLVTGTFLIMSGGIALFKHDIYERKRKAIVAFTDLFQSFVEDPKDEKVLSLMQSYERVIIA